MSILPGQETLRRLSAWPRRGRASSPRRWRSLIRMDVRDLIPLPLRYFAAVQALRNPGLRFSNYGFELRWSYGDSNPRPLACHETLTGSLNRPYAARTGRTLAHTSWSRLTRAPASAILPLKLPLEMIFP